VVLTSSFASQDSMDEQSRHTVNDYSSFLALNSHAFGGNPELILQQALNLPAHMKPALEARELLAASCHDALLRPLEVKEVSIPVVCNLQHSSFKPAKDVSFIKGTSSYLCSLSSDSSLKVFDYRIGEEVCEIRHVDGRSPLLSAAVFHRHDAAHESKVSMEIDVSRADSICIIGGREDGSIIKWSGSATDMPELETSSSQLTASVRKVLPLSSTSHDSIFALTGMSEIYSVDIDTLEGSLFYKHDQQIVDCSISEDTSVFVIGDNYHVSSIISIKSQIIQQKRRHEHPVHAVAVTVPKKLCASGLKAKHSQMEGIEFFRGPIELWNISTGEQVAMLEGGTITGTYSLNFSNDGKYLVSVMSWCPTVWDCDTFQCIMTLPSSEPAVTAKFSPDCNNMIASCDSMGRQEYFKKKKYVFMHVQTHTHTLPLIHTTNRDTKF
jgi:WD40 repeat protein